jgi:hypothetical protein
MGKEVAPRRLAPVVRIVLGGGTNVDLDSNPISAKKSSGLGTTIFLAIGCRTDWDTGSWGALVDIGFFIPFFFTLRPFRSVLGEAVPGMLSKLECGLLPRRYRGLSLYENCEPAPNFDSSTLGLGASSQPHSLSSSSESVVLLRERKIETV